MEFHFKSRSRWYFSSDVGRPCAVGRDRGDSESVGVSTLSVWAVGRPVLFHRLIEPERIIESPKHSIRSRNLGKMI